MTSTHILDYFGNFKDENGKCFKLDKGNMKIIAGESDSCTDTFYIDGNVIRVLNHPELQVIRHFIIHLPLQNVIQPHRILSDHTYLTTLKFPLPPSSKY